jgi:lipid A 3-O-deacylase
MPMCFAPDALPPELPEELRQPDLPGETLHLRSADGTEFAAHAGGTLGNAISEIETGAFFRLGQRMPLDFGPPRISNSASGSGFFQATAEWGWYLFIGSELRYVARNLMLDGNTFRDSPSVEREPWVGEVSVGAVWYRRATRITYTHVWRTREFKTQDGTGTFGGVSVSWRL